MTRNNLVWQFATAATVALCLSQPQQAFSQALPWQSQSSGSQAQQTPQHSHHHSQNNTNAANTPAPGGNTRDADDRRLDTLAGKFYHIHEKDTDAIAKMKKLEGEV